MHGNQQLRHFHRFSVTQPFQPLMSRYSKGTLVSFTINAVKRIDHALENVTVASGENECSGENAAHHGAMTWRDMMHAI